MKRVILGLGVLASVTALIVGTTSAFFTDSETTGDNRFHAGTLSIDLSQEMHKSLPVIVNNWAPGETATVEFDVVNTGTLPVNLRTYNSGRWDFPGNPNFVKVLRLERFNDVDSTWVPLVENQSGVTSMVYYSPNGAETNLFEVAPGKKVNLRQTVLFDATAGNEYQGRTFTANITVDAKQVTAGATWPDSSSTAISCPTDASLSITRSQGGVVVSWPTSAVGYALETASALSGPWTRVTTHPVVVGGCYVVTDSTAQTTAFYRLASVSGEVPTFTITGPSAEATLVRGTTHPITWTSTNLPGSTLVAIQLKNVATGNFSNQFTGIQNSGSVQWTVPLSVTPGRYTISINNCLTGNASPCVSFEGPSVTIVAENGGTPTATLSITAPQQGASVAKGSAQTIRWTSTNVPSTDKVSLQLKSVTTGNFSNQATAILNNGSYAWTVPATIPVGSYELHINTCTSGNTTPCMTVKGPTLNIIEQGGTAQVPTFSISAPANDSVIARGTPITIRWNSTNLGANDKVALQIRQISTNTFTEIATAIPNSGSYTWTVPLSFQNLQYDIHINSCVSGNTASCVTIQGPRIRLVSPITQNPSVSVTEPVADTIVSKGNVTTIRWTSTNVPATDKVSLQLRKISTNTFSEIATGIPNSGSYAWTVPTSLDNLQYEIHINTCVSGNTSSCLTVQGPRIRVVNAITNASIEVVEPAAGSSTTKGGRFQVKWNTTNIFPTDSVTISLKNASTNEVVGTVDGVPVSFGTSGISIPVPNAAAPGKYHILITNCTATNSASCATGVSASLLVI